MATDENRLNQEGILLLAHDLCLVEPYVTRIAPWSIFVRSIVKDVTKKHSLMPEDYLSINLAGESFKLGIEDMVEVITKESKVIDDCTAYGLIKNIYYNSKDIEKISSSFLDKLLKDMKVRRTVAVKSGTSLDIFFDAWNQNIWNAMQSREKAARDVYEEENCFMYAYRGQLHSPVLAYLKAPNLGK